MHRSLARSFARIPVLDFYGTSVTCPALQFMYRSGKNRYAYLAKKDHSFFVLIRYQSKQACFEHVLLLWSTKKVTHDQIGRDF